MFWVWIKMSDNKYKKYKRCSPQDLFKIVRELRRVISYKFIEVTKEFSLPNGNHLVECDLMICAECPKALKKTCPLYKLYNKCYKTYKKNKKNNEQSL